MNTYHQIAQAELRELCGALGLERELPRFEPLLTWMLKGWGEVELPLQAPYASAIGDDHSPFEFSLALAPRDVELRLLVEAQGSPPDSVSNRDAALAFNRRLAALGVDFERFERIADLFLPPEPAAPFTLWHAVGLRAGRAAEFKVYLNPQVRGRGEAWHVVSEALGRLGLSGVMPTLRKAASRAADVDVLAYFSLDLSGAPSSRVKVYFQHLHATAAEIERVFALAPTHQAGDVLGFCRTVAGSTGPFSLKPVCSCFSFVQGNDRPSAATFHFPVAHYVDRDAETLSRVQSFLRAAGIADGAYTRALTSFAPRALSAGSGVQSYASFRRDPDGLRFTAYLSPELFRSRAPHASHQRLKALVPPSTGKRNIRNTG
jgi:DMATS type aromatic prenyltransferase